MTGPGRRRRTGRIRGLRRGLAGPARLARLAVSLALAGTLAAAVAGCGGTAAATAGPVQPPVAAGQQTAAPDLAGVQLPDFVMPLISIKGGISLPDPKLTPGAVVTADTKAVCSMRTHGVSRPIPSSIQTAVDDEYGYTTPVQQHRYILNYLVPWYLGGALDLANVWPAAIRGTGFYEKIQTDVVLRELVCQGELPLTEAQHLEETDWYSAWLRFVVVAGRT